MVSGSVVTSVRARGRERVIVRDGEFSSASRHELRAVARPFYDHTHFHLFSFFFSFFLLKIYLQKN